MSPVILNSADEVVCPALRFTLCMIVKNEDQVIERCLRSVQGLIDSWVIVDTGSSDETMSRIALALQDLPGNLLSREWVDFSTARNQALEAAFALGGDYALIIDADEEVCHELTRDQLEFMVRQGMMGDVYLIDVVCQTQRNPRIFLVKNGYPGRYRGAIHEDLEASGIWIKMGKVSINSHNDGARHKNPNLINDDLKILFSEIEKDPKNSKNYYYLGVTYFIGKDYNQAEKAFQIFLNLGKPNDLGHERAIEYLLAINEWRKDNGAICGS